MLRKKRGLAAGLAAIILGCAALIPADVFAQNGKRGGGKAEECESFAYDGVAEVYLGQYCSRGSHVESLKDHVQYDVFKVYDEGIVQEWSSLSNPQFICCMPRGGDGGIEKVDVRIKASIIGAYPDAAEKALFDAFDIGFRASKRIVQEVWALGPSDGGANSREFYYRTGTHRHAVRLVHERYSNWDGLLWSETYCVFVELPDVCIETIDGGVNPQTKAP